MHEEPTPPPGWFVYQIKHEHTPIIYASDTHEPIRWIARLQRYPNGGHLVTGLGTSFTEAWQEAVDQALRLDRIIIREPYFTRRC